MELKKQIRNLLAESDAFLASHRLNHQPVPYQACTNDAYDRFKDAVTQARSELHRVEFEEQQLEADV